MKTHRIPFARSLVVLTLLMAGAAQATPVNLQSSSACNVADLGNHLASDCLGYRSGNDSNSALVSLAGAAQWHGLNLANLTQYKDGSAGSGSTTALFDVLQSPTDASKGTLTFLLSVNGPFVLTLKGGNYWAAYYVADGGTAGTTYGFDIPGRQGRGLSHASIYTAVTPTKPPPATLQSVPEPSSAALVLLALGGVGAALQRRQNHPD